MAIIHFSFLAKGLLFLAVGFSSWKNSFTVSVTLSPISVGGEGGEEGGGEGEEGGGEGGEGRK